MQKHQGNRRDKKAITRRALVGEISITSKGVGYVEIPGKSEDIEISPEKLNTALHNDRVEIELASSRGPKNPRGIVLKILKRAKTRFVGTIQKEPGKTFLVADDRHMYKDILLSGPEAKSVPSGTKALVLLSPWIDPRREPEGKVLSVIGKKGEHNAEMESIVMERGFSASFPEAVEKEASGIARGAFPISADEIGRRRDCRGVPTMTIDPVDAKDFDDALSFRALSDGHVEVGVHIADVSHFVREKTPLDIEARERGFSVYLVDRTIPMLPHALSNGICSLNPNEDRLAFSAIFTMTRDGKVKKRWFGKTVIHSKKRFSYEEAQGVLDASAGPFAEELSALNKIANKLRLEKFAKGAIDFEQDEVGFTLDELGAPLAIFKKPRLASHKLVEELMLLANREVAEFIYNARGRREGKEPFIYRVHDLPDREKLANLQIMVRALGHDLPLGKSGIRAKDLQALFKKIEGRTEEALVKTAALRTMAKAVYSTRNIGHFGLAFPYYTHFTSPIRRYADLLVHRLLEKHLTGKKIPPHEWHVYETMAVENSEREIAAAEAERESKKMKQVEYMAKMIGQTFDGIISGVTDWGIYVEEPSTRAEGMIKIRDIGDDFYVLDEKNYRLVGKRTGRRFSLGDKIKIKVVAADPERKTLDYKLA